MAFHEIYFSQNTHTLKYTSGNAHKHTLLNKTLQNFFGLETESVNEREIQNILYICTIYTIPL